MRKIDDGLGKPHAHGDALPLFRARERDLDLIPFPRLDGAARGDPVAAHRRRIGECARLFQAVAGKELVFASIPRMPPIVPDGLVRDAEAARAMLVRFAFIEGKQIGRFPGILPIEGLALVADAALDHRLPARGVQPLDDAAERGAQFFAVEPIDDPLRADEDVPDLRAREEVVRLFVEDGEIEDVVIPLPIHDRTIHKITSGEDCKVCAPLTWSRR